MIRPCRPWYIFFPARIPLVKLTIIYKYNIQQYNNFPEIEMEYHQTQLEKHCRICGGRLYSSRGKYKSTVYGVKEFKDQLQMAFGVETSEDLPTIHPRSFCKVCKVAMGRLLESKAKEVPYRSSVQLFEWAGHEDDNCKVLLPHK